MNYSRYLENHPSSLPQLSSEEKRFKIESFKSTMVFNEWFFIYIFYTENNQSYIYKIFSIRNYRHDQNRKLEDYRVYYSFSLTKNENSVKLIFGIKNTAAAAFPLSYLFWFKQCRFCVERFQFDLKVYLFSFLKMHDLLHITHDHRYKNSQDKQQKCRGCFVNRDWIDRQHITSTFGLSGWPPGYLSFANTNFSESRHPET